MKVQYLHSEEAGDPVIVAEAAQRHPAEQHVVVRLLVRRHLLWWQHTAARDIVVQHVVARNLARQHME